MDSTVTYSDEGDSQIIISRCPEKILAKILQCAVCGVENSPLVFGSCERRGHAICNPCYTAFVTEMDGNGDEVVCPAVNRCGTMCGSKFIPLKFDSGISAYWHYFLRRCEFRCSSAIYGCPFKGAGRETMEHETSDCEFGEFRRCRFVIPETKKLCEAQFHSAAEFMNHYVNAHGFPNGAHPVIRIDVPLKETSEMKGNMDNRGKGPATEQGERIVMKICSYAAGKYCFIIVENFERFLRIWATEADATADAKEVVPIKITIPAPQLTEDGTIVSGSFYQFLGKVMPFKTFHITDDDDITDYMDVPKAFLRRAIQTQEDGKGYVSLIIGIGSVKSIGNPNTEVLNQNSQANEPEAPQAKSPGPLPSESNEQKDSAHRPTNPTSALVSPRSISMKKKM